MDLQLTGKTAVVTGASKGIGLEIVRGLAAEGVSVVAVARTITPELRALDGPVTAVTADPTTTDGATAVIDRASDVLGEIDIVVNNVGGVVPGSAEAAGFLDIGDDAWQRTYELNLFATVRVVRRALPSLLRRRPPRHDPRRIPGPGTGPHGLSTGRLTEPYETAALVTFLASSASGNLTGADYVADGGAIKTV